MVALQTREKTPHASLFSEYEDVGAFNWDHRKKKMLFYILLGRRWFDDTNQH